MRKYFIASVVAMVAFAMAAFAASLTVNAATIQAGEDVDVDCVGAANVAAWGYDDTSDTDLKYVTVDTIGEECTNDEVMHLIVLDGDGHELARGNADNNPTGPFAILNGTGNHQYSFELSGVKAEDVEGVRIGVDQGHTDYSY